MLKTLSLQNPEGLFNGWSLISHLPAAREHEVERVSAFDKRVKHCYGNKWKVAFGLSIAYLNLTLTIPKVNVKVMHISTMKISKLMR